MQDRTRIALAFAGFGLIAAAAPLATAAWAGERVGGSHLAAGTAVGILFALAWGRVSRLLLAPAADLAAEIDTWLGAPGQDGPLADIGPHGLDQLPLAVGRLCDAARQQRHGLRQAAREAGQRADEQRAWLDVALRELAESVVVCDPDHRILFHNRAAERALGGVGSGVGLGALVPRASLDHAMDCLKARMAAFGRGREGLIGSVLFSCRTRDGRRLLQGQASLVLGPRGAPSGYVVVFRDVSESWADLDPGDAVRQALTRDFRGPLGALHAAAQMLADFPDMSAADRASFIAVVRDESARLGNRLESMAAGSGGTAPAAWPMADIHFSELFACVAASLERRLDLRLTMVGVPLWLHGDSHSLMEAFLALFAALHAQTGVAAFDMECMLGDRRVYVDINWKGQPVPDLRLSTWLEAEINTALGPQRVRDVLDRHDSQPWSLPKRGGFAALRVPLPLARRPQFTDAEWSGLGAPPTLSEADLRAELLVRSHAGAFAGRRLDHMVFVAVAVVVPKAAVQAGDRHRITALGAVRVENGRLLTARTFERHLAGGGDGGAPPLAVVLPQFEGFAGDAVVVVHGLEPCLGLLEARENGGTHPPVLDTMEVSRLLDPDADDHSLEAVAGRLGVRVGEHRTEIGKALLTAEILIRQMDRLAEARLAAFDQVMDAIRSRLARTTDQPVEA